MADPKSAVEEIRAALELARGCMRDAGVRVGPVVITEALARLAELPTPDAIAEAERRGHERATRGHIELISALAFLSARDGVGYRPEEIFRRARANGWRDDDDRVGASERAKGGA